MIRMLDVEYEVVQKYSVSMAIQKEFERNYIVNPKVINVETLRDGCLIRVWYTL